MKTYTGDSPPNLSKGQALQSTQVDKDGGQFVKASIRYVVQYEPASDPIPNGPCDAILTYTADAIVDVIMADDTDGVSIPIAPQIWHPMQCSHVTGTSDPAGMIWLGWFRKPT